MIVKIGEYQNKPTISYMRDENDRWPVTMGSRKVAAVIANMKDTIKFLLEKGGDEGKKAVDEFLTKFQPVNGKPAKAEKKEKVKA